MLTKAEISEVCWSNVSLFMHTICYYSSVSTANTLLSVTSVIFVVVWFSFDASCTISTGTGCELHGTIVSSADRILLPKFAINNVSKRTGTAEFLTILTTALTRVSPACMWSINMETTMSFGSSYFAVAVHRLDGLNWCSWVRSCAHTTGSIRGQFKRHTLQDSYAKSPSQ